jgi:predicted PurR-regulated permease PerM
MPFMVGRVVHLHPVLMLFGILAGFSVGGVFGLIFAIPFMAVVKIVLSSVLLNRRETRIFQNQKMMS